MRIFALVLILLIIPVAYSENTAEDVAVKDLRELYHEGGIYAGANQFSDYWARDAMFASLGSNAVGDFNISKNNLQTFLKHQKDDGQFPMRVGSYDITLKLLGIDMQDKPRPRYDQDKLFSKPRDQNCLVIIAAEDYIFESGDIEFAEENFEKFEKAIAWLAATDKNGNLLVEEGNYAGWTDSVKKNGEVLYTNVCYAKAMHSLANIAELTNQTDKSNAYHLWSNLLNEQINKHFWEGEYYVDWVDDNVKYTYFATDANVLAIIWDVADEDKTEKILNYIETNNLNEGFGVQTATGYNLKRISPINIVAGISDYHSNIRWLWVSCFYAQALAENNHEDVAEMELKEIKEKIEEHGVIYEVYESDGEPINRWFYKAEHPFAWSSGVCTSVFKDLEE
jgi:glycogen debranching enzyme